jgi:hypothetical protein
MQHGAVPNPESRCDVRRVKDAANFIHRHMPHQHLIVTFASDGVDLPHLCQGRGDTKLDISEKGLDCRESPVACCRGVAPLFLYVSEEIENEFGSDLLKTDL